MSGDAAREYLAGHSVAPVCGITWVETFIAAAVVGSDASVSPCDVLPALATWLGADLAFVPQEEWAAETVGALRRGDVAAAWTVAGPIGRWARSSGWPDVLMRCARDPVGASDQLSSWLPEILSDVQRGLAAGADAIVVADDVAGDGGRMFSADVVRSLSRFVLTPIAQLSTRHGVPTVFHSDGDLSPFLTYLGDAGVRGVHVALPGGCLIGDVVEAADKAGLVVLGGIGVRDVSRGDTSDADDAVKLARTGALMLTDDGGILTEQDVILIRSFFRRVSAAC